MIGSRLRFATVLALAACQSANGAGISADEIGTAETAIGMVLVDDAGMTLYTFDEDSPGTSNCTWLCAANWPPLIAGAEARPSGDLTIVMRADGRRQWAIRDMPLYGWAGDTAPGDTMGDGVFGTWRVARP